MCAAIRRVGLVFLGLAVAIVAIRAVASDRLVRQFNKHLLNPFALWVVARRPMYYGVIHHVGRHTGRLYCTPVVAKMTGNGIIIPLPYGPDADWYRNLRAAGRASLTLAGVDYAVENPTIVGTDIAGPSVPTATARLWRWMGIEKYLQLKVERLGDAQLGAAA